MCFSKVVNPDILPHPTEPNSTPGMSTSEDTPMHTATADGYEFDIAPCCIKRPLVIFIGGFADEATKVMYTTCKMYAARHKSYQDIYYRPHDQGAVVRGFVEKYAAAGQKVAVIGHSWGGNTAVYEVAMKAKSRITTLGTLDPVSKAGPPDTKPSNVDLYVNIYINYLLAETQNNANSIARIGHPWEETPCADVNHDIIAELKFDPNGDKFDHADAYLMFNQYLKNDVASLR